MASEATLTVSATIMDGSWTPQYVNRANGDAIVAIPFTADQIKALNAILSDWHDLKNAQIEANGLVDAQGCRLWTIKLLPNQPAGAVEAVSLKAACAYRSLPAHHYVDPHVLTAERPRSANN